eukprot:scaffold5586_cov124-Isochrysis_galbana.AAC.2
MSRTRDGGGESWSHRGAASARLAAIWVKVLHTLKNGYPAPTTATRAEAVSSSSTSATQWGSGPQSWMCAVRLHRKACAWSTVRQKAAASSSDACNRCHSNVITSTPAATLPVPPSRRSRSPRTCGDEETITARTGRLSARRPLKWTASRVKQCAALATASSTSNCERLPARQSLSARTCRARSGGRTVRPLRLPPCCESAHLAACSSAAAGVSSSARRAPNRFGRNSSDAKHPPTMDETRRRSGRLADLSRSCTAVKACTWGVWRTSWACPIQDGIAGHGSAGSERQPHLGQLQHRRPDIEPVGA